MVLKMKIKSPGRNTASFAGDFMIQKDYKENYDG